MMNTDFDTVILANGEFPKHELPLSLLGCARRVVCCDGALAKFVAYQTAHGQPANVEAVVGDGDSVSAALQQRYANKVHIVPDQETNDLTKAINYCVSMGYDRVAIVGATGLREDHTLGNISLLMQYSQLIDTQLFTDYGVFTAINKPTHFDSFLGQQVSIFSLTPDKAVTVAGLAYPIVNRCLRQWWEGTLNAALGDTFSVIIDNGEAIIFQTYDAKH